MKKETILNFRFFPAGGGRYNVTYISPTTGKQWTRLVHDTWLIDATKGNEDAKQSDLNRLKAYIKFRGI